MSLNNIIEELILEARNDQVIWIPLGKPYKARDGKELLRRSINSCNLGIQGAWSIIWNLKVPPKIQTFLWKVEHGILPSKVLFARRMLVISLDKTCLICKQAFEDQDHILWSCSKSIWIRVLAWWDIKNRLSVFSNFQVWSWLNWFKNQLLNNGWGITIVAVLWSLWLNRNRSVFELKQHSLEELVMLNKIRTFRW